MIYHVTRLSFHFVVEDQAGLLLRLHSIRDGLNYQEGGHARSHTPGPAQKLDMYIWIYVYIYVYIYMDLKSLETLDDVVEHCCFSAGEITFLKISNRFL